MRVVASSATAFAPFSQNSIAARARGSGQAQELGQNSTTSQTANSSATAEQNGVNANVPVSVSGDGVSVGGQNYGLNGFFIPFSQFSPSGFNGRFVYGRVSFDF